MLTTDDFGGKSSSGLSLMQDLESSGASPQELTSAQITILRNFFEQEDGFGLYAFTYFICGARDLYFPLHFGMCQVLSRWGYLEMQDGSWHKRPMQEGDKIKESWRRLHLCVPRDHFKTTVGTRATALWVITKNSEATVGIWNENGDKSKSWVGATKKVIEESKLYHMLWPEVLPKGIHFLEKERGIATKRNHKWGDTGLLFNRSSHMVAELSMEPFGIGGASAGKHFTHVIKDDIIGDKAAESDAVMDDAIKWVDTARALERPAEGGCELVNYTRWAYYDVYKHMLTKWRGQYKLFLRHMLEDENGNPDVVNGKVIFPTRFTTEQAKEMYEQDPFVFMCLPDNSPVTLSDWTEKSIKDIQIGDEIVGYDGKKLTTANVEAVGSELGEVWGYELEDGTVIFSTPNHKWGVIRKGAKYEPIKVGSVMRQVYKRREGLLPDGSWLAGFYDGDGSLCGNALHFIQNVDAHAVCDRLFNELKRMKYPYTTHTITRDNERWGDTYDVWLTGGRSIKVDFLQYCKPSKKQPILDSMFKYGGRLDRRKVVKSWRVGTQRVWKMQTSTRNYVAYGMLSSNSQYMCIPMSGRTTSFQPHWLRYGEIETFLNSDNTEEKIFTIEKNHYDPRIMHSDLQEMEECAPRQIPLYMMNKVILLDPAPSKVSEKRQAPRSRNGIVVVGIDPWDRHFCLESLPLKEDPVEVMHAIVKLMEKWSTLRVGIEEVVFSAVYIPLWTALIAHEYPEVYPEFIPLFPKGRDKDSRIFNGLAPKHKTGFWYYNREDTGYITQELVEFPNGETKDLIDAASYIDEAVTRDSTPDEERANDLIACEVDSGRSPITGY